MNNEEQDADAADMAIARGSYSARHPLLRDLCRTLESEVTALLGNVPRIDRIGFRPKTIESFARKSVARDEKSGQRKYEFPLVDIEDQVAGRVLVFFRSDIDVVVEKITGRFRRVEQTRKEPASLDAFSYESEHLVFTIPPDLKPNGWEHIEDPPPTFEMQVRTLFMHAWAEPQHDIAYKPGVTLTKEEKRSVAWAASNAWGGDQIFEDLFQSIRARA